MASFFNDVKVRSLTKGLDDFSLGSAVEGWLSFSDAGVDGETIHCNASTPFQRESFEGIYTASTGIVTRTTIYSSTNGDAKVNFTEEPIVIITHLAVDSVAAAGGDVTKVGTPANSQIGVWTGDGTIEGDADLLFDTATNTLTLAGSAGTSIYAQGGANILVDSPRGTMTLSNIDLLDSTTQQTIEDDMVALDNLTTAAALVTVGTIGTGVWEGDAVAIGFGGTGAAAKEAAFDALSPVTTEGDIIFRNATVNTRLARGSTGQVLTSTATTIEWGSAGSGDVSAAAIMANNSIVRGDGGAKGVQDSGILIDDSDNVSGMGTLAVGAITSSGDLLFSQDNPEILGGDTDGVLIIGADTANNQGGTILLYGNTHGSLASDIEFYFGTTLVLSYDSSDTNWDFDGENVIGIGSLSASTTDLANIGLTGSIAEFNTALQSATFGTFGAAQTDHAVVRADSTAGLLQTSGVIIDDSDNVSGIGTLTATTLAGTLSTAAQTNITSLGPLTALVIDDVAINGKVITMGECGAVSADAKQKI